MPTAITPATPLGAPDYRAVLWGGLAAGGIDLAAAFIQSIARGGTPGRVLQAIASGLLGADAFEGSAGVLVLGAVLHFVIALGAAAVFVAAARRVRWLVAHPFVSGPAYGIVVYAVMNLVVLPLSAIPYEPTYPLSTLATGIGIHMLCVGLPIALVARRYAR